MKNSFTLIALFCCCIAAQLRSQNSISTFQERTHVAERVIHGDCFKILSVTVNGNASSRSEFQTTLANFPGKGWLISTGSASNINQTPSNLLSAALNAETTGSDSLLTSFMIADNFQQINEQSYDATRVTWVVESLADDTLEIIYVFATEEFPQWAPPQLGNQIAWNDFPAILYKPEGSSAFTFASVIPGTQTPVTLQSVNPVTNSQYFVETLPTDSFAFNGRTVTMKAKIPVIGGQSCEIVLLIGDGGVAVYDSGIFLETVEDSSFFFEGNLVDNSPANQDVTLFRKQQGKYAVDTTDVTDNLGNFNLYPTVSDTFLIQASGNIALAPTYFPGVWNWEEAAKIDLLDPLCTVYAFKRDTLPTLTGNCTVSGKVFGYPTAYPSLDPPPHVTGLANVNVLLVDTLTNTVAKWVKTNQQGDYSFTNLPARAYRIYPDIPGIKVNSNHLVNSAACGSIELDYVQYGNFLAATKIHLQNPLIDVGGSVEWVNGYSTFNVPGFDRSTTTRLRVIGDTLFGDTLYHALYAFPIFTAGTPFSPSQAEYVGGFREQNRKIYARFRRSVQTYLPKNRELLYFDANLNVGGKFRSFANYNGSTLNDTMQITKRDTILIGGKEYTRWRFIRKGTATDGDPEEEFITGIGNSTGMLNIGINNFPILNSPQSFLLCYTNEAGNQLAVDEYFETTEAAEQNCFNTVSITEPAQQILVNLIPNPGTDRFTISTPKLANASPVSIIVRDMQGRLIFSGKSNSENMEVNASEWNAGAYFIQLVSEKTLPVSRIWIKQ
jgi:hypothetical protein